MENMKELLWDSVELLEEFAFVLLDRERCVQSWNKGAERIFGHKKEEALGVAFTTFTQDIKFSFAFERKCEKCFEDRCSIIRRDGTSTTVYAKVTKLMNNEGNTRGYSMVIGESWKVGKTKSTTAQSAAIVERRKSNSHDAIIWLSTDGVISSWNESAELLEGYTSQEIVGKHFSTFFQAEEQELLPEYMLGEARKHGRCDYHGWQVRSDGKRYWANVILNTIYRDNKHMGFLEVIRDLTAQKEDEKVLRAIEVGISCIVEYAIFLLDCEGNIMTWNQGAQRIKGYTAKEIIGCHISKFYTRNDADCANAGLAAAKREGKFESEGWRVRKDGSLFWAHVVLTAVYQNQENVGFIKVTHDLTQQRLAQLKVEQSERNYRTLISAVPVGIFRTNSEGQISFANPAGLNMFAIGRVGDQTWKDIVHEEDRPAMEAMWKETVIFNTPHSGECRVWVGNKLRWMLMQVTPEASVSSSADSFILTLLDIHDSKEKLLLEQRVREQQARTELAERQRESQMRFFDTVCHELRNPLHGVTGSVEIMKSLLASFRNTLNLDAYTFLSRLQELESTLDNVSACIDHQNVVINDVLDTSKLAEYKIELHYEAFSPVSLVKSAHNILSAQAVQQRDQLVMNLPPEDVMLVGDYQRVLQILLNFLSNAIKFTTNGKVTMSLNVLPTSEKEMECNFSVADTGIGMSAEEQRQLFTRFSASNSSQSSYAGSGLGLYIARELGEQMKGKISVESVKGQGTKFNFQVKLAKATEEDITRAGKKRSVDLVEKSNTKTPPHVLVVEDDPLNRKVLVKYLTDYGCNYQLAYNGKEAVELFLIGKFDIIFMDIEMPELNGQEATIHIRKWEKDFRLEPITIVGVSGFASDNMKQRSLANGMNHYITKPFHKEEIFSILTKTSELSKVGEQ